jgi:hypothetical protein
MKRVNFKISVIALAIGLVMVSCGGGNSKKQGTSATPETKTEAKADGVSAIPKDKINVNTDAGNKEAVIAEIPAKLLKAVGELSHCSVMKIGVLDGYKYTLIISTKNSKDGVADLEKLIAYYKSIGGTVEKSTVIGNDYDITFNYAQSRSVSAVPSGFTINFSVVKQ